MSDLDTSTALEVLGALWAPGHHSLCAQRPGKSFEFEGAYDEPAALVAAASRIRGDVWWGVHGMADRPATGRGGADDVTAVGCIVADLDWHDGEHHKSEQLPTEDDVRARLAPFRPTSLINTGAGLHAYWSLDRQVVAAVGKALTDALHAALAAAGLHPERKDLASVLRVPGSLNHKSSPPRPVMVELLDGPTWTPEQLRSFALEHTPRPGPAVVATRGPRPAAAPSWMDAVAGSLDMVELLDRYGWQRTYGNDEWWTRPGKSTTAGHSARINEGGRLFTFSSATEARLPCSLDHGNTTYDPLDVFAAFEGYGTDRLAAARTLKGTAPTPPRADARTDARADDAPDWMPASWSDAHVGEAFGATLAGRWVYCRTLGGWHRWDGRRWAVDPGEAVHEEFRQWIIDIGNKLWQQAGSSEVMRQVARYRDRAKIDAAVTIARRLELIAANADDFDQHPHLLNVHNGVVDLHTGALHPHDPALRMTKIAGGNFRPADRHADVDAVLAAVSDDVRPWVQRLLGSAAYGRVVDDVLAVFDGTGSNGKTTLLKAAAVALGDYAAPASTRLLMARGVNDEHPTLLADLLGRRLVYIEETPEGGALRMEQVKNITGGGSLKARFIGRDYFEFEPSHQIIVATNHRPAVNASDYAAWRRLRLVPFPYTFRLPHEAQPGDLVADRGLRARLGHPAQRDAMLSWIVAGAVAWHAEGGLGGNTTVDAATTAWRRDEDIIAAWWADRLEPGGATPAGDLYRSFVDWCQVEGRRFVSSNKEFAKRFTDHDLYRSNGITKKNTAAGAAYLGVRMVDVVGSTPGFSREGYREPAPPPTTTTTSRGDVVAQGPF